MTTYNELVLYFEGLTEVITGLSSVIVGDDEAIETQQNTRIVYPVLWVETPTTRFMDPGGVPVKRFRFALVVVTNEPKKTASEANAKLSITLDLMERIFAQIYHDAECSDEYTLVLNDAENEPVRRWSADNCYGWRLEIEIDLERCECPED